MGTTRTVITVFLGMLVLITSGCAENPGASTTPTLLPPVVDLSGIKAEGRLEPIRYVHLSPAASGLVSEVLVSEGERVEAGQVIARLDGRQGQTLEEAQAEMALELGNAHNAVRVAKDDLDAYNLPMIFSGLSAEEAARTWLSELDAANAVFAPFRDTSRHSLRPRHSLNNFVYPSLPGRVLVDTREYEGVAREYKKRVDVARTNYTKAVAWLQLESALVGAQARLAEAQRRYDALLDAPSSASSAGTTASLAAAEIRAPFAGTVTDLSLRVGEVALAGTEVATVADFSAWLVRTTDLTEIDVPEIDEGMAVVVVLDALPDTELEGSVLSVDLRYTDVQGDVVYPVTVVLTKTDAPLRWGMTAEVTFEE